MEGPLKDPNRSSQEVDVYLNITRPGGTFQTRRSCGSSSHIGFALRLGARLLGKRISLVAPGEADSPGAESAQALDVLHGLDGRTGGRRLPHRLALNVNLWAPLNRTLWNAENVACVLFLHPVSCEVFRVNRRARNPVPPMTE